MKKQGEIITIGDKGAVVRIYKGNDEDAEPTALTVSCTSDGQHAVGDMVYVDMNMTLFFLSTFCGYVLPFVLTFLGFIVVAPFTDNILIIDLTILVALVFTYFIAEKSVKHPYFKNTPICKIIESAE